MFESFTAGALRALSRAQAVARARHASVFTADDLLAGLVDDPEGRAALLLAAHGADLSALVSAGAEDSGRGGGRPDEAGDGDGSDPPIAPSDECRLLLAEAWRFAKGSDRTRDVGTEHLLAALLERPEGRIERLVEAGLRLEALREALAAEEAGRVAAIPLSPEIPALRLDDPTSRAETARILDASGNRAREGLRVIEDYVRFALDDPGLTRRLKEVRHRLAEALRGLEPHGLTDARDTPGDVGTHIMTAAEQSRESPRAVVVANFKRVQEALRSLEEYSKLIDVWIAGRFEVLRYDVYLLEKRILTGIRSRGLLGDARLYLLVGGLPTLGELTWVVAEALAGGVQVVQLREKRISDRQWLERAQALRSLATQAGVAGWW